MSPRAVVIGTGFGGLAMAVRLKHLGYDVTVLEANAFAGGRARVFERDGYTFDAGPTVVTAPYLLDELFTLVGRDPKDYFELLPVDPYYRIKFHDGTHFDFVGADQDERMYSQIAAFNPDDVEGYRKLMEHSQQIFDVGFVQLADQPFHKITEMFKVIPAMIKLENYRTVSGLVAKYIKDERLRRAFTFEPLLVGGNPFDTTSIYLLIHWLERKWGVHFAKGGTGTLIRALLKLLDELGVEVRFNSPVATLDIERGAVQGVVLEDGERIPCVLVASNADPSIVYTKMIAAEHRFWQPDWRVRTVEQSMSAFVTYFAADRTWPHLAQHTVLLTERYKELLTDIFDRKVLPDDFSLYLHAPTVTDPSLAPPGCTAFYVLSPVPNNKSGVDWATMAEPYKNKLIDHLDATELPGLRDSLQFDFAIDPRYFEGELRSALGAAFGPRPIFRQSAWFRYHNQSPDIRGLYFVGAGTHPGAGMPGVLCSAKVVEKLVPRP